MPERETRKNPQVLLAFDFGLRRIGVASGQTVSATATPLTVLVRTNDKTDWRTVEQLIADWQPDALVVGLPLHADGKEQTITKACRHFAKQLEARFGLPTHLVDERYTSREAQADFVALRRAGAISRKSHARLDAVAAQRILENWLQAHHG